MTILINLYDGDDILAGGITFLYELMQERDPEINISHSTLPTFEEHTEFVRSRPYRLWYIISHGPIWVGCISATDRNEIGIVLRKDYRGKGIGPDAIKMLIDTHEPLPAEPSIRSGSWLANIAPSNTHSRRVFEKLGFEIIQHTLAYKRRDYV